MLPVSFFLCVFSHCSVASSFFASQLPRSFVFEPEGCSQFLCALRLSRRFQWLVQKPLRGDVRPSCRSFLQFPVLRSGVSNNLPCGQVEMLQTREPAKRSR